MTEAGLNTVNLSQLNTFQQFILFLLILLGSAIWVSIAVVYFRRKFFERRFKSIVAEERQRRRNRSSSGRRLSLPGSRSWSRPEVDGVVVRGRAITSDQKSTEEAHGHLTHSRDQSQHSPKPVQDAEGLEAENSNPGPPQAEQPSSIDTGVTRRITFASPASPTRKRQHGRILSMQGVGARQDVDNHPLNSPRPMYPGELPRIGEEAMKNLPLPQDGIFSGAYVGRNSQFSNLSFAEREKLGGVEYRAVECLAVIVPLYFILWQLLGCIGLGAYVANNRASTTEVNAENSWYTRNTYPVYLDPRQLTPLQGGLALSTGFPLLTTAG